MLRSPRYKLEQPAPLDVLCLHRTLQAAVCGTRSRNPGQAAARAAQVNTFLAPREQAAVHGQTGQSNGQRASLSSGAARRGPALVRLPSKLLLCLLSITLRLKRPPRTPEKPTAGKSLCADRDRIPACRLHQIDRLVLL